VSVDRLLTDLYEGAPPPSALSGLQAYVSHLRRTLEPHRAQRAAPTVLLTAPPGYALRLPAGALDADAFAARHSASPLPMVGAAAVFGALGLVDAGIIAVDHWDGRLLAERGVVVEATVVAVPGLVEVTWPAIHPKRIFLETTRRTPLRPTTSVTSSTSSRTPHQPTRARLIGFEPDPRSSAGVAAGALFPASGYLKWCRCSCSPTATPRLPHPDGTGRTAGSDVAQAGSRRMPGNAVGHAPCAPTAAATSRAGDARRPVGAQRQHRAASGSATVSHGWALGHRHERVSGTWSQPIFVRDTPSRRTRSPATRWLPGSAPTLGGVGRASRPQRHAHRVGAGGVSPVW
jgi:hypothetical protein